MLAQRTKMLGLSVVIMAIALVAPVQASINHGDFFGVTMDYLQVTESSVTDPLPLYNAPTVLGDYLDFNPTSFGSSSSGVSSDVTDGQLNMTIRAKAESLGIHTLTIEEDGDVTLSGLMGTAATAATIGAPVFLDITEVDGVALLAPIAVNGSLAFTNGGMWDIATDGVFTGRDFHGFLQIDLTAALRANGVASGYVTELEFTMDNTLTTGSEIGTTALIVKKDLDINGREVPEPATLSLLALGGLGLLRRRRNRRKA